MLTKGARDGSWREGSQWGGDTKRVSSATHLSCPKIGPACKEGNQMPKVTLQAINWCKLIRVQIAPAPVL